MLASIDVIQVIDLMAGEHHALSVIRQSGLLARTLSLQDSDCGCLRGGSAFKIETCAGDKLLFANIGPILVSNVPLSAIPLGSGQMLITMPSAVRVPWSSYLQTLAAHVPVHQVCSISRR
jgi:hypothetical protein